MLFGKGNRQASQKMASAHQGPVSKMSEHVQSCLGLHVEEYSLSGKSSFLYVCMDINCREPRAPGLLSMRVIRPLKDSISAQAAEMPSVDGLAP